MRWRVCARVTVAVRVHGHVVVSTDRSSGRVDIQPLPVGVDVNVPGPFQWMLTSAHRRAESLAKRIKHMQSSLLSIIKPGMDSGAVPEVSVLIRGLLPTLWLTQLQSPPR